MTQDEWKQLVDHTKEAVNVMIPLEFLQYAEYNPRTISEEGIAALKASMTNRAHTLKFNPIIVNKHPDRLGVIISGNRRVHAGRELGLEGLPGMFVYAPTLEEEKAINIVMNKHQGDWDQDALKTVAIELHGLGVDMSSLGFLPGEMVDLLGGLDLSDPKSSPDNKGTTPRKKPKMKIAEGTELECPNCHSVFTYGIKAEMTGS